MMTRSMAEDIGCNNQGLKKNVCAREDYGGTIWLEVKSTDHSSTIYNFTMANEIPLMRSYFQKLGLVNEDGTINDCVCHVIINKEKYE